MSITTNDPVAEAAELRAQLDRADAADRAEANTQDLARAEEREAEADLQAALRDQINGVAGAEDRRDAALSRQQQARAMLAESLRLSKATVPLRDAVKQDLARNYVNHLDDHVEDAQPQIDAYHDAADAAADALLAVLAAHDALKAQLERLSIGFQERVRARAAQRKQHLSDDRIRQESALPAPPVSMGTVSALRAADPLPPVMRAGYRLPLDRTPASNGDDGVVITDAKPR